MGILDEAIRDHLDLKRKGGTPQPDLKRLEDEAFGPPSRPGDAEGATAIAEAERPKAEPASESDAASDDGEDLPSADAGTSSAAVEEAPAAPPESPEPAGGSLFHDFAAEEGLVAPKGAEPAPPTAVPETPTPQPEPTPDPGPPTPTPDPPTPMPEPPAPGPESSTPPPEQPAQAPSSGEVGFDDTQPHDMASELDEEALELHLDEEDLAAPEGSDKPAEPPSDSGSEPPADSGTEVEVVEDEEVELEVDVEEVPAEDDDDDDEDVLEETPEFLRDTPEHDRLWFEQKPPKDFDFDE